MKGTAKKEKDQKDDVGAVLRCSPIHLRVREKRSARERWVSSSSCSASGHRLFFCFLFLTPIEFVAGREIRMSTFVDSRLGDERKKYVVGVTDPPGPPVIHVSWAWAMESELQAQATERLSRSRTSWSSGPASHFSRGIPPGFLRGGRTKLIAGRMLTLDASFFPHHATCGSSMLRASSGFRSGANTRKAKYRPGDGPVGTLHHRTPPCDRAAQGAAEADRKCLQKLVRGLRPGSAIVCAGGPGCGTFETTERGRQIIVRQRSAAQYQTTSVNDMKRREYKKGRRVEYTSHDVYGEGGNPTTACSINSTLVKKGRWVEWRVGKSGNG
ncbi:hypothetical protein F5148DRAFT_1147214 [Russula earlei]|uniref:Uncharacterized protein n=1 Tax=Russula earlei TaxID=71964 RepID=A0ACC0UHY2_9AGAM|nr:hypothetical protein F5148DRAFT_1147214 [Russula earlei]